MLRPEAEDDLGEATLWYELQRPGLGAEFLAEVEFLLGRIAEASEQFPEIEGNVRRALLRRFPYALYFLSNVEPPMVLAVLHFRRPPDAWKGRH